MSGFTQPPVKAPRRGKPAPKVNDEDEPGEEDTEQEENDSSTAQKPEKGLAGEAGDTRELDLGETERYELDEVSMDQKEAGYAIEPFNMKNERSEGHFDDDFNYVRSPHPSQGRAATDCIPLSLGVESERWR